MPRNGATKTETAAEPNELYDSLSQESQDLWDNIGTYGYTPEKGAAGLWYARKLGQPAKEVIGPAEHISVLLSMVKEQAGGDIDDDGVIDAEFVEIDEMEEIDVDNVVISRSRKMLLRNRWLFC